MTPMHLAVAAGGLILMAAAAFGLVRAFQHWYVSVDPDEFVVHYRRGGVKNLGRGLSFVCLPGDTFLRVPSTIRDINFAADQITQEKQGVRVQGFLAYKIADFELAYRSLDLKSKSARVLRQCEDAVEVNDFQERNCEQVVRLDPSDPLAKTDLVLRRLAESVVRHEVSNKTVDEMITERESVIQSMREQLQETVAHWGIEIDTIEFTEVWIRSKELFDNMQALHRNEARLKASQSTTQTDREIAENRLRTEREIAELEAEAERIRRIKQSEERAAARQTEVHNETRLKTLELEEAGRLKTLELEEATRHRTAELERRRNLERLAKENEFALAQRQIELEQEQELARLTMVRARQEEEHQTEVERRSKATELEEREIEKQRRHQELKARNQAEAAERAREVEEARARLEMARLTAMEERRTAEVEAEALRLERQAVSERRQAEEGAAATRVTGAAQAEALQAELEAKNAVGPEQIKKSLVDNLPRIAESMKVKDVRWVNLAGGQGGSPMEMIPQTIAQTLGVFQGMGVDLEDVLRRSNQRGSGSPGLPEAGAGGAGNEAGVVDSGGDEGGPA